MNTRQKIIETTIQNLLEKGFYGLRIDDILQKSRISKGSLYHYFPKGKEQLLVECLKLHVLELSIKYKNIYSISKSLNESLLSIIENTKTELEKSKFKKGNLLVNISQEIAFSDRKLQKLCKELFILILHTFEGLFLEYRSEKWQQSARTFVFKLNGAITLSKACQTTIFLDDLSNEYS